jgi:hypothetical protein
MDAARRAAARRDAARGAATLAEVPAQDALAMRPPPSLSPSRVPRGETDRVRMIVGQGDAPFAERIAAAHKLGRDTSAVDVEALLEFLGQPWNHETGLDITAYNAIKNDVLNALMNRNEPVAGLGERLAAMAADEKNDEVWRAYCLQHLAFAFERGVGAPTTVTNALWQAVARREKLLAGTALLGLEHLSRSLAEVDRAAVAAACLEMAFDADAAPSGRITALSLCGRMNATGALERARAMAAVETDAVLRMVAIATVGYLGDSSDAAALQHYSNEKDDRIVKSARAAIERLEKRVGTSAEETVARGGSHEDMAR